MGDTHRRPGASRQAAASRRQSAACFGGSRVGSLSHVPIRLIHVTAPCTSAYPVNGIHQYCVDRSMLGAATEDFLLAPPSTSVGEWETCLSVQSPSHGSSSHAGVVCASLAPPSPAQ